MPVTEAPRIEGYDILRELGRGAMGVVYLARDRFLERDVAIKLVAESELTIDGVDRFLREARAMARLSHPNVVTVYRAGVTDGAPFLVMELLRGRSLDQVLEQDGPLSAPKLLSVAIEAARGIAAAHARGVVHRDIKPSNLFETEEGTVKVLDFGIAKVAKAPEDVSPTNSSDAVNPAASATRSSEVTAGRITAASLIPAVRTSGAPSAMGPTADGADEAARKAMAFAATVRSDPQEVLDIALEQTSSPEQFAVVTTRSSGSRDSSAGTKVSGTALFMAPEVWRSEGADHATDVWSLGATLYLLATGRPPFNGCNIAEIAFNVLVATPVEPLGPKRADLQGELVEVIERCLSKNRAKRFASAQEVLLTLERISRAERVARAPRTDAPYPGLRAMDAQDRDRFFGRDDDITRIIERLRGEALVVLVGASGTGKSSLAAAGIAPAVAEGALGELRPWRVARVRPGRAPIQALSDGIAALVGLDAETLAKELVAHPDALARTLREAASRDSQGVLLLLDQLEELVTTSAGEERDAVAASLARLVEVAPRGVRVLATARSDLFDRLGALGDLGARLGRATELVRPLEGSHLRAAIVEPARAAGASFEDETLVDRILEDVGTTEGALPLIAFAMRAWWDRRDRDRGLLTRDAWQSLGGVLGALGAHADNVYESLAGEERDVARAVFSRLVANDGTRRYATRDELEATASGRGLEVRRVLDSFAHARLLQCEGHESSGNWTIAHESLFRAWPRLRQWIESGREDRALHEQLSEAVRAWEASGKRNELLWHGALLQEIRRWRVVYDDTLTSAERAFVERSIARARRSQRVWGVVIGALALGLGGAAVWQRSLAQKQRLLAQSALYSLRRVEEIARSEGEVRALAAALEGMNRDSSAALAWLVSAARARGAVSPVVRVAALAAVERGVAIRVRCTTNVAMRENGSLIACGVDDSVLLINLSDGSVRRLEAYRAPRSIAVCSGVDAAFWIDSAQQLVRWDEVSGRRRLATDVARTSLVLAEPSGSRAIVIDPVMDRLLVWDEERARPSAATAGADAGASEPGTIGENSLRVAVEHLMPSKIAGEWRAHFPVKEAVILAVESEDGYRVRRIPVGRGMQVPSTPMDCGRYRVEGDALLCHDGQTLRAFSVTTGSERAPSAGESAAMDAMLEPEAPAVLARSGDFAVERDRRGRGRLRGRFPFAGPLGVDGVRVEDAAIEPTSHRVAIVDAAGVLHLYGLGAAEVTRTSWLTDPAIREADRVRATQSGRVVVQSLPDERAAVSAVALGVFAVDTRAGRVDFSHREDTTVAVNAEANLAILATSDGAGVIVDPVAKSATRGVLLEGMAPVAVAVSADGARVAAVGGHGDTVWRATGAGEWRRIQYRAFSELSSGSALAVFNDRLAVAGRWLGVVQEGGLTTLTNGSAAFYGGRVSRLRFASDEHFFAASENGSVWGGFCRDQRCQVEWLGTGDDVAPLSTDAVLTFGAKGAVRMLMRARSGALEVFPAGRMDAFVRLGAGLGAIDVDDVAIVMAGPPSDPVLVRVALPPSTVDGFVRWVALRTNVSVQPGGAVVTGAVPTALP